MEDSEFDKRNKVNNGLILGIILSGAALVGGTIYHFTSKEDFKYKLNTQHKQEMHTLDSTRVADHNALAAKYNTLAKENTTLKSSNDDLQKRVRALSGSNSETLSAYESALAQIDSMILLNKLITEDNTGLEGVIKENKLYIINLENTLSDMKTQLMEQQRITKAQTDTLNIMQRYLNAYVMSRRPIHEKNMLDKYDSERRILPKDADGFKGMKILLKHDYAQ